MAEVLQGEEKAWYAFYTKSKSEFKAEKQINSLSIECYLPTLVKLRQWSDRKKKVIVPLMSGYIFVSATEKERLACLECDAIIRCVFDAGKPAKIPEWQLNNLRELLKQSNDLKVETGLIAGTRILIKDGPFAGITGVIQETDSQRNFIVSVDLLNRSVIAKLPKESIVEIVKEK